MQRAADPRAQHKSSSGLRLIDGKFIGFTLVPTRHVQGNCHAGSPYAWAWANGSSLLLGGSRFLVLDIFTVYMGDAGCHPFVACLQLNAASLIICDGMVTAPLQLPAAIVDTTEYCSCLQVLQRLGLSR